MKSIMYLLTLILFTSLLESCEPVIQSLYPLYTAEQLIEEPNIEGTWYYCNSKKDTIFWKVKSAKNKKYLIKVHDTKNKNKEVFFYLHLIELKDNIYADLFAIEESSIITDSDPGLFFMSHITPVHSFSRLSINTNTIDAQYYTSKWLKSTLRKHKKCVDYKKIKVSDCEGENCYLLLSPPKVLQKIILKYGKDNSKLEDNRIRFKRLVYTNN